VDALLREAGAAYRSGDYARAADLYKQAEDRATDPGMVALNRAAVKYRLALADGGEDDLKEAEQLYRCCTGADDPRRPRALYGLGNCLLLKSGDRDLTAVRSAIGYLEQYLREATTDEPLAADARHNLERARLLALQIQAATPDSGKPPPDGDTPPDQRQQDRSQDTPNLLRTPGGERPDPRATAGARKPDPGQAPRGTDDTSPGKGNLPPIADQADPAPLSEQDAAEHLEQAARRITEERMTHRQRNARPPASGVRDW
jgi:tetratricopeptide (TPR) repeat protein